MAEYDITPVPNRLAEAVQLRIAFSKERGTITRFMVQLEYWLDSDWREIVRYDHARDAPGGHDITEEGLHRDVFRDGEKVETVQVSGPIPANEGFNYAEDDLRKDAEHYTKRFEQWHDIKKRSRPVSDEEYEEMPERIEDSFDRIREIMADELGGDPEDYEPDDLDQKIEQ
jgi:hypothetical protein